MHLDTDSHYRCSFAALCPPVSVRPAASSSFYTPHLSQPPPPFQASHWPALNSPSYLIVGQVYPVSRLSSSVREATPTWIVVPPSGFLSTSSCGATLTCCSSLFPPECHACYHRNCFRPGRSCPRCQRLAARRERMARRNMEEAEDEGGKT